MITPEIGHVTGIILEALRSAILSGINSLSQRLFKAIQTPAIFLELDFIWAYWPHLKTRVLGFLEIIEGGD